MSEVTLRDLLQELAEQRKFDLRGYKISSVERRFRHRMFQLKIGSYSEYAEYLRDRPDEVNHLLNTVLINVTAFFRDPPAWEILRHDLLPQLTAHLKMGDPFRVLSAGCASGEEPYSVAILLAEHFGDRLAAYDIKVYATDVDEEALNVARRGEYTAEKLQFIPAEWRKKYFVGGGKTSRIARDVRHMAIFGRSNLASDAPISHVNLLLCRNVLIYFDLPLQRQILRRLHYALQPGGLLMLGKSESQLAQSSLFSVVNAKWRIFQPREVNTRDRARGISVARPREGLLTKTRQEDGLLKLYHDAILQTLEPSVVVVDPRGVIISDNEASRRLWKLGSGPTVGKPLSETAIPMYCPELLGRLETLRSSPNQTWRFEFSMRRDENTEDQQIAVTVKAVITQAGAHVATLIYAEDISPRRKLQHTVEELETTSEELQSANEELETTNEELQSTNEELETTNEELQSTNEELETTNEELQALNEELGTTNEELEVRSKELDELNERYSETLERMPWPLLLVSTEGNVEFWNASAARMFGLGSKSVIGLSLSQLPLTEELRGVIARNYREALARGKPKFVRECHVDMDSFTGYVNLQFTPLANKHSRNVIVAFEALPGGSGNKKQNRQQRSRRNGSGRARNSSPKSHSKPKSHPKPKRQR
jgi:two-component system, chemotaxis family, CheB/CheR fusion protein